MSKSTRAHATVLSGAVGTTAGVYGMFGWPAAALAAGAQVVAYGLVLVDVDEPEGDDQNRRRRVIERG